MKPGWKTSEFWLSLAAVLLGALLSSDVIPSDSPALKIVALCVSVLGALGYTAARGVVKSTDAKAQAIVAKAAQAAPTSDPSKG